MRKAAIEDASVEMLEVFEAVSAEAKHEKKAIPPVNKMVYYWTRKPLIVGRAVALACTLEKPEDVRKLLGFGGNKRAYKSLPNLDNYRESLEKSPSKITVLDPFAGTGNLAFPSAELGLNVTCFDYNPLAHLIECGSLQIPSVSESSLAKEFEEAARRIISEVKAEVGQFYEPGHLAYLWAWCVRCNHCSQRVPLLNQMYLGRKKERVKKIGLRLIPTRDKNFTVEIDCDIAKADGKSFTHKRNKSQCMSCGSAISYESYTQDIAKNKDRELLAIQIQRRDGQGRDYILPSEKDIKQHNKAIQHFAENLDELLGSIPTEQILASHSKENALWTHGIEYWNEFFSERQLLVLSSLVQKINAYCKLSDNTNMPVVRMYLAFLVARLINAYSYGVLWSSHGEKPEHALTMRRPSLVFNLTEINPFEKVRGSLQNNVANITRAIEFCTRLKTPIACGMESVTTPTDKQYDLIITDPPYGGDVQYGELSEYLYLWMKKVLKDDSLPARAPLDEDFCESQGRFGDKEMASEFFEKGLKKSFVSINDKLKDDGLLAVFFAHSSIRAWNQLLLSLRAGGFRVVSSYALHTESKDNPLARNKASFMSSIVVACRKLAGDSSGFMEDIIPDTEDGIRDILEKIPNSKLLTLPITDLLVMVYGKVLESCTRHRTLKSQERRPQTRL